MNAFDAGEYGLGMCTNSLELGCDCLGEIRYFDGVLALPSGEPASQAIAFTPTVAGTPAGRANVTPPSVETYAPPLAPIQIAPAGVTAAEDSDW